MEVMEIDSQQDMTSYVLTPEEASERFAEAGVPRSPRTVLRYCSNDTLDCAKEDTALNWRYKINQDSVEKRIKELQQLAQSGHDAPRPVTTSYDESQQDGGEIEGLKSENHDLKTKVEGLEKKNLTLEISNSGLEQFISLMKQERAGWLEEIKATNRKLGFLEERLGLAAPSQGAPSEDPENPQTAQEPPNPPHTETPEEASQPGSVL